MSRPASRRKAKQSRQKGRTPTLTATEARTVLDSIATVSDLGLRDRALIALMIYTFAPVGAVVKMRVRDVYLQRRWTAVRFEKRDGGMHNMPMHPNLKTFLREYVGGAGIGMDPAGHLFRSARGKGEILSEKPMNRVDVYRMIRRRVQVAGIKAKIGCHSFRATGITEYLRNGGKLEFAQHMANHKSSRTTSLYAERKGEPPLDEVKRIVI
jgi:integrase